MTRAGAVTAASTVRPGNAACAVRSASPAASPSLEQPVQPFPYVSPGGWTVTQAGRDLRRQQGGRGRRIVGFDRLQQRLGAGHGGRGPYLVEHRGQEEHQPLEPVRRLCQQTAQRARAEAHTERPCGVELVGHRAQVGGQFGVTDVTGRGVGAAMPAEVEVHLAAGHTTAERPGVRDAAGKAVGEGGGWPALTGDEVFQLDAMWHLSQVGRGQAEQRTARFVPATRSGPTLRLSVRRRRPTEASHQGPEPLVASRSAGRTSNM